MQLLLVAERSSTFGGLLRLVLGAESVATLSLLANSNSVTEMSVRDVDTGVITRLSMQSPTHTITLSPRTVITMRVIDTLLSVAIE